MDLWHRFFLVARDDALHSCRWDPQSEFKVMDLGTGSGIWANSLAEKSLAEKSLDEE